MTTFPPIGQFLLDLGLISREQLEVALQHQHKRKERLGELLVTLNYISEVDMLKVLADRYKIHYMTSDKLAQLSIPRSVLDMIPLQYAEPRAVLPILYDKKNSILSILASNPTDLKLIKEVQLLAQCNEVKAYLALRPAILAAIKYFYRSDDQAFTTLGDWGKGKESVIGKHPKPMLRKSQVPAHPPEDNQASILEDVRVMADKEAAGSQIISDSVFIELLNILISLIELRKDNFRGHSASVANFAKQIAEKLKLGKKETFLVVIAAYLHDLGKKEGVHPTLANIRNADDFQQAKKYAHTPVRLVENVNFPRQIPAILGSMFERWDGKGFPEKLKEKEIPIGSRILALLDAYEDLVRTAESEETKVGNILNKISSLQGKAFDPDVVSALFDIVGRPDDSTQESIELRQRQTVMFVDTQGTQFTPLIGRLKDAGYRVLVARDTDTAISTLKNNEVSMILSEVNAQPLTGVQFCQAVKTNPNYSEIYFLFLSNEDEDPRIITEGFDAGAEDFYTHPLRPEVILAKIKRLFLQMEQRVSALGAKNEQAPVNRAAVSGSLEDLALPDLVQLLTNGRKTGMLVVQNGEGEEGRIFVTGGMVINSSYKDLEGEEAFYQLLRWNSGTFSLETSVTLPEQKIMTSPENLMLEGFRLMDEEAAGKI